MKMLFQLLLVLFFARILGEALERASRMGVKYIPVPYREGEKRKERW